MVVEKKHKRQIMAFKYGLSLVVALLVLIPLYVAVMGGFKTMGQLMTNPFGLTFPLLMDQYAGLLSGRVGFFWSALFNSVLVSMLTVAVSIIVCAGAAFALSRIAFYLNGPILAYFLLGLLFPIAVAMLPLFLQIRDLGLMNTHLGVALPQVAFQIPMQVLLMYAFFKAIPQDLEDACSIDGHGPVGFLIYMVLPLSTPILATTGVITLVASWNNFFLPLLVFNDHRKYTLPLGVMDFMGQHMTRWNLILGYVTLALIPAILFFIFAQRYIVAGLTGGAVKG
ncbi:thiamine ABC transporter ATP-binding protein [Alkalispirochaeta sphaeroplastigenens]|uniref:Thiamine ABC transporter ATP-binding protein n=1 Tax=Alkalispirochaeta sphaeroplastigenens TaxID=1187066 RepID=A0A2S4JLB5_9SPIO|nr:carbohydrate ABC transporter permease [Alkalispirochaeta sphaeroplastigenens]POR00338.1 thiamine ABC transporter ATP-binding protein [Alkalispirochaeta sphaeroplastigenens]